MPWGQINHDSQIGPAFVCLNISDIGHPNGIRNIDFELSVQRVVSDHSRLAAVPSPATPVANLCGNARLMLAKRATRFSEQVSP